VTKRKSCTFLDEKFDGLETSPMYQFSKDEILSQGMSVSHDEDGMGVDKTKSHPPFHGIPFDSHLDFVMGGAYVPRISPCLLSFNNNNNNHNCSGTGNNISILASPDVVGAGEEIWWGGSSNKYIGNPYRGCTTSLLKEREVIILV
jgi:hypothetical protein